jgi:glycosyltransferase involved in cell wall biosynthesis
MSIRINTSQEGLRTFSAIIPTNNRPEFLLLAVESARNQSHALDEIIVVDNDSRGLAKALLQPIMDKDDRVHCVTGWKVPGPSHARNVGARHAKGEYLAFLDDDDLWHPGFIEHVDAQINRNGVQFVLGWFELLEDEHLRPGKGIQLAVSIPLLLRSGNLGITGSNIVIHRDLFNAVDGFDEELEYSEDRDFLIRLVARGISYGVVQNRDVIHRVHPGARLSDLGNKSRLVGARRFYRKHRSQMSFTTRALRIRDLHYAASHIDTGLLRRAYHALMASLLGDRRPTKEVILCLTGRNR